MTGDQIATRSLIVHGAILLAAVGAYYKYGDRAVVIGQAAPNIDRVLGHSIQQIARRFERVMDSLSVTRTFDFGGSGAYIEKPANPTGSDKLTQILEEFVSENAEDILDYREVYHWRNCIYTWSRCFSRLLMILIFWQAMAAGIQVVAQFLQYSISNRFIVVLFVITAILVVLCLVNVVIINGYRDRAIDKGLRH